VAQLLTKPWTWTPESGLSEAHDIRILTERNGSRVFTLHRDQADNDASFLTDAWEASRVPTAAEHDRLACWLGEVLELPSDDESAPPLDIVDVASSGSSAADDTDSSVEANVPIVIVAVDCSSSSVYKYIYI